MIDVWTAATLNLFELESQFSALSRCLQLWILHGKLGHYSVASNDGLHRRAGVYSTSCTIYMYSLCCIIYINPTLIGCFQYLCTCMCVYVEWTSGTRLEFHLADGVHACMGHMNELWLDWQATGSWIQAGHRKYFRGELLEALLMLQNGTAERGTGPQGEKRLRGSWAGAMGQCQFMPTSFREYAIDYDGDGRKGTISKSDFFFNFSCIQFMKYHFAVISYQCILKPWLNFFEDPPLSLYSGLFSQQIFGNPKQISSHQ